MANYDQVRETIALGDQELRGAPAPDAEDAVRKLDVHGLTLALGRLLTGLKGRQNGLDDAKRLTAEVDTKGAMGALNYSEAVAGSNAADALTMLHNAEAVEFNGAKARANVLAMEPELAAAIDFLNMAEQSLGTYARHYTEAVGCTEVATASKDEALAASQRFQAILGGQQDPGQ
jgi:hypothetical protein